MAPRVKCQSNPCCNLAERKSDAYTKLCLVLLIQKFISYYPSFVFPEVR